MVEIDLSSLIERLVGRGFGLVFILNSFIVSGFFGVGV